MEGRGPLKSAARVRFLHSLPQPVRLAAKTPLSEGGYRKFESFTGYHFVLIVQRKGHSATNRKIGVQVLVGTPKFFGPSSNWTGRIPPKDEIPVRPRMDQPSSRWRPTGEVLRCLRSLCGFDSRSARQIMRCNSTGPEAAPSKRSGGIVTRAPYHGAEHERLSAVSFKHVTVGSLPTCPTSFGSET